jgi:hypothetical protein
MLWLSSTWAIQASNRFLLSGLLISILDLRCTLAPPRCPRPLQATDTQFQVASLNIVLLLGQSGSYAVRCRRETSLEVDVVAESVMR